MLSGAGAGARTHWATRAAQRAREREKHIYKYTNVCVGHRRRNFGQGQDEGVNYYTARALRTCLRHDVYAHPADADRQFMFASQNKQAIRQNACAPLALQLELYGTAFDRLCTQKGLNLSETPLVNIFVEVNSANFIKKLKITAVIFCICNEYKTL